MSLEPDVLSIPVGGLLSRARRDGHRRGARPRRGQHRTRIHPHSLRQDKGLPPWPKKGKAAVGFI
jgi:hypothetical protein